MYVPSSSDGLLPLALNGDTGSIQIGNIWFHVGADEDAEYARDVGRHIFDALVKMRNENFQWRHFSAKMSEAVKGLPSPPEVK